MFRPIEQVHLAKFNSANSSDFLDFYGQAIDESILEGETKTPSRTFAPSQIRCKRVSWFRLRGVEPEQETTVDRTLNFKAQIGTACHKIIQETLSEKLGDNWIDPEHYITKHVAKPGWIFSCNKTDFETQVEITEPVPIKFAPDGIIFWKDKYWLLEIKTSEYNSFEKLTDPKPEHIDQIKCYATILNIQDALVLYQDRLFGELKCFEVHITEEDMTQIWGMFKEVQDDVIKNIAPPKLPTGDKHCTPSICRYYNRCKEW